MSMRFAALLACAALAAAPASAQIVLPGGGTGGTGSGVASLSTSCPSAGPFTAAVTLPFALQTIKKTASYTGLASDCGAVIQFTITAAATYTGLAPATAGNGYSFILTDYGTSTSNLTFTPAAGTINGATSLTLFPGGSAQIWTDGSNYFTAFGVGDDVVTFTTVGTTNWTPNQNLLTATISCMGGAGGGGGGGASAVNTNAIFGGGSGGAAPTEPPKIITRAALKAIYPTTVAIGVGAGGTAGVGVSGAAGTSGGVGGTTFVGGTAGSPQLCRGLGSGGGGGGGGGAATGASAGGGGGGLSSNAVSAAANSNTGGGGGAPNGSAGVGATGAPTDPYLSGGFGGVGGTATAARTTAVTGLNAIPGAAGAPVLAGGGAVAGAAGATPSGCLVSSPVQICFAGAAGTTGSPNGGNAASGLFSDGTLMTNGMGIIGGGSGGSGASCSGTGTGCTPGNAGTSSFGAGGSGGGAAYDPTTAVTGGSGAVGGQGVVQIYEKNSL
jgi:hypothetical protein